MFLNLGDIGNPLVLGMVENDQELRISEVANYIDTKLGGGPVPADELDDLLLSFGVNRDILPKYLQERIERIRVY